MITTTQMQLVDINKLIPYVNNARTHSPEQITKLRSSLREFGFINPVLIDRKYNVLAGHGRIAAAKEEGITEVPCVFVEHLSEAQKKAYILADNRMAMDAGWDTDLLLVEMESLKDMGFDIGMTGFDEKEIADLFETDTEGEGDNFDVDAGDSTDPETYKRLLGDTKVNLVCTDAPYFVNLSNKSGKIANDNLDDKAAYEFLMKTFTNFKNAMAKDASIYEFYATMKTRVFYDAFEDAGFKVGAGLIWKKPRAPFMRTDWKFNMEPIIWGWRKDGKHIWYGDQKQTAVFEFEGIKDSEKEGFSHPSSKPVPLIVYLILVLDGFLGSATTLIACEQIDRTCYGIELEPKFVDVAVVRYLQYKNNDSSDVYVIRDGQRIDYKDVPKLERMEDNS